MATACADSNGESNPADLLAPIALNSHKSHYNGTTKKPNPVPYLDPSPLIRSGANRPLTVVLDDMEPPPVIPAALEENAHRSRPSSTYSLRWAEDDMSDRDDGYLTPVRRTSAGSGSTTAWAGENSPGGHSMMGTRPKRSFFKTRSHSNNTSDVEAGDYSQGEQSTSGRQRWGFFGRSGNTYKEGAESEDLPADKGSVDLGPLGSMSAPTTPRLTGRLRRRATTDLSLEEHDGDIGVAPGRKTHSRRSSFKRIARRQSHDGSERPSYISAYTKDPAAKWRKLKAGIKLIGHRKKEESKIDREKSAELVAELSAGAPAVLILASMFQRDEHDNRRIPVLLEQLKIKITDSDSHDTSKGTDRARAHFRIELEYGSGLTRMKWVIDREFRDFFNLHSRYKLASISDTPFGGNAAHRLPKFPKSSIPYLKGIRGLEDSSDEDADAETSGGEGHGTSPKAPRKKRPKNLRKKASTGEHLGQDIATGIATGIAATAAVGGAGVPQAMHKQQGFTIRQRQQLEEYLRRLIRIMIFRPDSNRLCKFLELSALGVRLAAEGGYHGKEGYLIVRSAKGSDFRKQWNPTAVAKRHSPKWFLVRHSYIVCVDSPEEMNIYDVFLVDSSFQVDAKKLLKKKPKDLAVSASANPAHPQHHSLTLQNSERVLKLLAKNERQQHQFTESIRFMKDNTPWVNRQRFGSFAPVRTGVFAQWLVDGRDYYWNASRAISMAKDVIYIHDWWLSPELYLRRPAAVSQKWRLDRLLKRKAEEGVKIFVIVYRNIGAAIPIDSQYTKYSLLDLHKNVFVQRSPNQFRQQTFFWAHHEKILIVDHMIAFVGGIDLCFGRWDTPQHSVVDDKPSGFEEHVSKDNPEDFQLWPGKDYSNPRVQDFFALDKPYEDMYDRGRVPRMPWHDIHMQVVGQPARDLTRHFVQRWNYLLRQRKPSRPTPLLLPPPDFQDGELESLGIDGTCEVQILRSASSWSLGTPNKTEHSIQDAYLKAIEMSDHLVYIENQFFVTSTEVNGTVIENKIGDALVERIIRAYKNDEDWRAIIILPLMPGFQNTVDAQDGTSVRLIMQCQYRSISRGEHSIFERLKAAGIEPDDFITFYSLRNWGKIGVDHVLVTEQLYIHAKCMVVDDRIAIIGSANINERSMLGSRDSEVAAIVRDTDVLESTMAGRPYKVGRFPHTLRVRLMREHLGMDVDEIMAEERMEEQEKQEEEWEEQMKQWQTEAADTTSDSVQSPRAAQLEGEAIERVETLRSFNHDVDWEQENNPNLKARKKGNMDPRVIGNEEHKRDVRGFGADHMAVREAERLSMSSHGQETLRKGKGAVDQSGSLRFKDKITSPLRSPARLSRLSATSSPTSSTADLGNANLPPPPVFTRMSSQELGLPLLSQLPPLPATSDQDIGCPLPTQPVPLPNGSSTTAFSSLPEIQCPKVTLDMFEDPLNELFYLDIWNKCAMNNTAIYRQVFRCMPDNEVKTWDAYKEYSLYQERFVRSQEKTKPKRQDTQRKSAVPSDTGSDATVTDEKKGETKDSGVQLNLPPDHTDGSAINEKIEFQRSRPRSTSQVSSRLGTATTTGTNSSSNAGRISRGSQEGGEANHLHSGTGTVSYSANTNLGGGLGSTRRKRRGTTWSAKREFHAADGIMEKEPAEKLLGMIQGHLVMWPYDWLVREQDAGNWLYSIDQLAPIEI